MTKLSRRAVLTGALSIMATPALARAAYRIADVDVRVSRIVASRIRTDIPGMIVNGLRRGGQRGGRPIRVVVELRTIDPYRPTQTFSEGRGIAVRYRVVDAANGRTIAASRFIERTTPREDDIGTIRFATRPITRGTQERELARGVASQILRDLR